VLSGFSKTFSVTGWRLGYVTADARWMPTMAHFHDLTYVCAPAPFQHGAAAGLEQLPPSFYKQVASDHQGKRERLLSALRDAGMEASAPPGAYYVLAKASVCREEGCREGAESVGDDGRGSGCGVGVFQAGARRGSFEVLLCQADAELDDACERLRRI